VFDVRGSASSASSVCRILADTISNINSNARVNVNETHVGNSCVVDFSDTVLRKHLKEAGKDSGPWSTVGGVSVEEFDGKLSFDGDFPVNLAECRGDFDAHMESIPLYYLSSSCRVAELHIHGSGTPSAHLRIECRDVPEEKAAALARELAEVASNSMFVGRAMCEGRWAGEIMNEARYHPLS